MSEIRVLIADKVSEDVGRILQEEGIQTDFKPGRAEDEILTDIGGYDAMVVRSATKVTRRIIEAADRLRVIGRAGVGVDSIDCEAATEQGVVVMNTPAGNVVSAAEHTVGMLLALARDIPAAHAEVRQGTWNRSAHTGVELEGKTLGILGLGKIGQHVARVCRALGMRVLAHDPYINPDKAGELRVRLVGFDAILGDSDFLTVHTPATPDTMGMIDAEALGKMKPGARIINVARGGIVDEGALADALRDGRLSGAAVDVYSQEPVAVDNPLLEAPNVVLTPHLGASTREAQSKVAETIAKQIVAFFKEGVIQNAVNLAVHLEPELAPYGELAEALGLLAVQMCEREAVTRVKVACHGRIAHSNVRALAVSALAGVLRPATESNVNLVNASTIAQERGIELVEESSEQIRSYESLLSVETEAGDAVRRVSGTCFDGKTPRVVEIDGLAIDLKPAGTILIMRYDDRPGMVGKFGTILGNGNINIASMDVGRVEKGADAVVALTLDDPVPDPTIAAIRDAIAPKEIHLVSLPSLEPR